LFTPSWHGARNQNMVQVEDLVSHGFVVVGVDHPYGSAITVFPDGRVVRYRPQDNFDTSTDESTKEAFRIANEQVHVRAADLSFVLDSLQKFNARDPQGIVTGHLDLARVGIFGYSLGGAVALQAAWEDPRFKATEDLDGMLFGESGEQGTEQPFMEVTGAPDPHHVEMPLVTDGERRWAKLTAEQDQMIARFMTARGGYLLGIQDIGHGSFTDAAFSSPMRWISGAGGANPHVVSAIVDDYTLAFFEKFLNGEPEQLFNDSNSPFSGVSLKIYARPEIASFANQVSPAHD
jgi:predicted dienelactone hydrolase